MTVQDLPGKVSTPDFGERTFPACIAVICAFAAMGTLATNIFLPSLPAMAASLHVSSAAVTSAITVYLAILAVGQLIVGPLSDRFGRRPMILIGLCLFVAGTIGYAFARDLSDLLIGRSIQASGGCAAFVLSRAIARDLFDGRMLTKVMTAITIATAAAPGFSPLLGGTLDHFLGWRSEFIFVAVFAVCAVTAYASFVGETIRSARTSMNPLTIAKSYLALIRDIRFVAPARTSGLLMVALFAIFSSAPRVFVESLGFSPITLGLLFAGVVFVVFAAGVLAAKLAARLGLYRATVVGLGITVIGSAALLLAVLAARDSFLPFSRRNRDLSLRIRHCEPAVELGGAIAIRQQGWRCGSPARLHANGRRGVWRAAGGGHLQRSSAGARNCGVAGVSARADPLSARRTTVSGRHVACVTPSRGSQNRQRSSAWRRTAAI
jgi:DHA1 family bicyclomycin/chloramphenicol resistance-like MFS transporter